MAAKMRNGGQACTAANRFHVAHAVIEEFTEKLSARISRAAHGPGHRSDHATWAARQRGPTRRRVPTSWPTPSLAVPVSAPAVSPPESPGFFYAPTLLDRIPADARVLREEIFGPVATVSDSTPKRRHRGRDDTEYGLASYFYTRGHGSGDAGRGRSRQPAWSPSTGASCRMRPPRSVASSTRVSAARAGTEGIEEYLETKYVAL